MPRRNYQQMMWHARSMESGLGKWKFQPQMRCILRYVTKSMFAIEQNPILFGHMRDPEAILYRHHAFFNAFYFSEEIP